MTFNVYNGEYPFDKFLGTVTADTAETALKIALKVYGNDYPHCIVSQGSFKPLLKPTT